MENSMLFATNVLAKPHLLHGVVEISWTLPMNSEFKEVAVYRKVNDFVTTELDPYGTLVYKGTESRVFDYSISRQGELHFANVANKILGTYDSHTKTFNGEIDDPLVGGRTYYYSVFSIDKNGNYHFSYATTVTATPTKNFGIDEKIYDYLPSIYRLEDKQTELQRFTKVIGIMYNFIMSETEKVNSFVDIDKCEPYQLQYIANQLDWELDRTLPVPSQRLSLKNAIEVYKTAGTKQGLDMLVKTTSGFPLSSGIVEGRDSVLYSTYFGYYEDDLIRYNGESTPDFDALDPNDIGKVSDPLKYTMGFSTNTRQGNDSFMAYVRKTSPLSADQELVMRERLTRLLDRFAPAGTNYEIDIY
jgi:phage tail-like protein